MILGQKQPALHGADDDGRGVGPQSVRLGEGAFDHGAQVGAAVAAAGDVHEGLAGQVVEVLLRQEDRDRAVFAVRRVEHGAADRTRQVFRCMVLAAGKFAVGVERSEGRVGSRDDGGHGRRGVRG